MKIGFATDECQIVLALGMGRGAYHRIRRLEIQPIFTDIHDVDTTVQAKIDGSIENHPERLH